MERLRAALQNPDEPSYPRDLRTLDQSEVHKREKKPIQLLEFQNWLGSSYYIASLVLDAYNVDCINKNKTPAAENLLNDIREYAAKTQDTEKQRPNESNEDNANTNLENVTVTSETIFDFAVKQKWLLGATLVSGTSTGVAQNDDGTSVTSIMPDTVQEALFNCCEELELLSRDYSNDEGQDSAVASGAMLDVPTEHPEYLIAQGMKGSALKRIPFPSPDWDNPLPEHTRILSKILSVYFAEWRC